MPAFDRAAEPRLDVSNRIKMHTARQVAVLMIYLSCAGVGMLPDFYRFMVWKSDYNLSATVHTDARDRAQF